MSHRTHFLEEKAPTPTEMEVERIQEASKLSIREESQDSLSEISQMRKAPTTANEDQVDIDMAQQEQDTEENEVTINLRRSTKRTEANNTNHLTKYGEHTRFRS